MQQMRAEHQLRYDLYHGCQEAHVVEALKVLAPKTYKQIAPLWVNVYRKVIDKLAGGLYRVSPTRTFTSTTGKPVSDEVALRVSEALDFKRLNKVLDKAARYLQNHRTLLLFVEWRHNRLEIDVLPPTLFHVEGGIPDSTCLEDADALLLFKRGRVDDPRHADEDLTEVWQIHPDVTPDKGLPQWYTVNAKGVVLESGDNPYTQPLPYADPEGNTQQWVYPAVLLQLEDPDGELYIKGGDDIVKAAEHVATELSDLSYVQRYQSYGQAVFSGVDPDKIAEYTLGPGHAIPLGPNQDFNYRNPVPLTVSRMQTLREFLSILAMAHDIPVETFDESRIPTSGVARRVASAGLTERRQILADRMAEYESDKLFNVMRAVYNAHAGKSQQIPWDIKMSVTAARITLPVDLTEADERKSKRAAIGLDNLLEDIMAEKGVDKETAALILRTNRADNMLASNDLYPVIAQQEKLLAAGVMSPVDIIMQQQGCDEPTARARFEQNMADMAKVKAAMAPPAAPPAAGSGIGAALRTAIAGKQAAPAMPPATAPGMAKP